MSEHTLDQRLAAIGADGYVSADEVLFLRRTVFKDGIVTGEELDALFKLGERAPKGDAEWPQFFAEAACDHFLNEEEPRGYLTAIEFQVLQQRVMRNGATSDLELGMLIKLMEHAALTPPEMSGFVGERLKDAIIHRDHGPVVTKNDVMLLRRYLFAAGGGGNVAITRAEAELLFDINDAVKTGEYHPSWCELFTQGIVNHLMAYLGYQAPSREEAFRRHAWAQDHSVNIGGMFRRMASAGFGAYLQAMKSMFASQTTNETHRAHNEARAKRIEDAAAITETEAEWLSERIGRDGAFDQTEKRLLERMRELENELPASLKELLSRAA